MFGPFPCPADSDPYVDPYLMILPLMLFGLLLVVVGGAARGTIVAVAAVLGLTAVSAPNNTNGWTIKNWS